MVAMQMREIDAGNFAQGQAHQGECFASPFASVKNEQLSADPNGSAGRGPIAAGQGRSCATKANMNVFGVKAGDDIAANGLANCSLKGTLKQRVSIGK
jgi:hypothetical protein